MASGFQDTVNVTFSPGGSTSSSTSFSTTGLGRAAYSGVIPDTTSTSGQLVDMAFKHADVVSVYLVSTQNLTINVNNDGTPAQSISLVANIPVLVNPFTVDVTSLYLRNASTTAPATVTLSVLLNSSAS